MDILIKNMEMPKACSWYDDNGNYHECRLFGYGGVCQLTKTLVVSSVEKRHEACPLVALPEHSDLIDRKALFDSIVADIQGVNTEGCYDDDEVELIRTTYQAVLYKLQNESPVIVEAST